MQELELVKLEQRIGKSESDTTLQNNFKTLQAQFTLLYNENEQVKQQLEETKHLYTQRCQTHMLQLEQNEVIRLTFVNVSIYCSFLRDKKTQKLVEIVTKRRLKKMPLRRK